jgi:hypothetical protein
MSIKHELFPYIANVDDPKEVWNMLKILYDLTTQLIIVGKENLFHVHTKTTHVSNFLKEIKEIVTQLARTREIILSCKIVQVILNAIPFSHESFVQTMTILDTFPFLDKLTSKNLLEK